LRIGASIASTSSWDARVGSKRAQSMRAKTPGSIPDSRIQLTSCSLVRGSAVEDKIQITIAAGPKDPVTRALHRTSRHEGSRARGFLLRDVPEGGRHGERNDDRGLARYVHELALAGNVAMVERGKSADRGLGAGPTIGLGNADTERRAVELAGQGHGP